MPFLFQQGVDQGSNMINVQRGLYAAEGFDIASPDNLTWAFVSGDDVFALGAGTIQSFVIDGPGLYLVWLDLIWEVEDTGKSMRTALNFGDSTYACVTDLGVSDPSLTGGRVAVAGGGLLTDAAVLSCTLAHDLSVNQTGDAELSVVKIY